MALEIKRVEFYNFIVKDHAKDGSKLLTIIAGAGVSLHAFKAVPLDSKNTQFTLFPDDSLKMINGAKKGNIKFDGPHSALLIKGDEVPGALSRIYEKLSQAGILVKESYGIADINEGYGVVLYLKKDDYESAISVLKK